MSESRSVKYPGASSGVARNFMALGGGEIVARLVGFIAYVYLARVLGAAGYGTIAFVVGIHLYLVKLADFGIESVGTSHVAQDPGGVRNFTASILGARLVLTLVIVAFSALVASWILPDPERTLMQLYLLSLLPVALNAKWVHLGLQKAFPVGISRILCEGVFLGVVVVFVGNPNDLSKVPLGALAGESSASVFLYILLAVRGLRFGLRWDPSAAWPTFVLAAPLVAQLILGLFIYNADVVFLRVIRDDETVGYYAAAYMLLSFLGNVTASYGMSLMPALARHQNRGIAESALYQDSLAQVYALALPVTVGSCLVAPEIIALWFGSGYAPAGNVLILLIWALPATALRTAPWVVLIARGKQSRLLRATVFGVFSNTALNLTLIGPFGMYGAAAATIATESIVGLLMFRYAAGEGLTFVSLRRLLVPSIASFLMAGALFTIGDSNLFVRIALGIAVYGFFMIFMGAIRFEGMRPSLRV